MFVFYIKSVLSFLFAKHTQSHVISHYHCLPLAISETKTASSLLQIPNDTVILVIARDQDGTPKFSL